MRGEISPHWHVYAAEKWQNTAGLAKGVGVAFDTGQRLTTALG